MERFRACFADLADPRTGNAQRHDLLEILLIALAATLSGAETWVDMAEFGRARVQTTDGDHGRIEIRRAEIVHDLAWLAEAHAWPGLQAVGKVTATRESDGQATIATRYYLLSRPLPAARFAEIVRMHWQIENRLHWVLDTAMDEDRSRSRKDHGRENLARLRRFALNLLRINPDKGSTRGKIKRAAWDDNFLLAVLHAA
jgi:predicted transposase YbfD/YdcC